MMEVQERKPQVEGMYTVHTDYKYGKPKLDAAEKQRRQRFQHQRCESRRRARENGRQILVGRY